MGENSSYLQTVGRSLEILELIGLFPGLTLSEVARQCNMSTTVVYRLLYTLTASGFLQQEPGGKRYFLGDKAILIGVQSLDNREVKRIAQYYMWDYYERTGEHCILTIPCAGRSICIEKIGSIRDTSNSVRSGGSIPCTKVPQTVCCWPFCRLMSSSAIWTGYPCTALHGKHWKPRWRRSQRAAMTSVREPLPLAVSIGFPLV